VLIVSGALYKALRAKARKNTEKRPDLLAKTAGRRLAHDSICEMH
jgi:hypothetical protein